MRNGLARHERRMNGAILGRMADAADLDELLVLPVVRLLDGPTSATELADGNELRWASALRLAGT